jgi:transposase-like protein
VSLDDALYRFRVRVFALAHELGSVRAACRAMGIHPSTYYRWRAQVLRLHCRTESDSSKRRSRSISHSRKRSRNWRRLAPRATSSMT